MFCEYMVHAKAQSPDERMAILATSMANLFIRSSPSLSPMAGTVKETIAPICKETEEDIKALLKGTDVAWVQYKRCQGTKVTDTKELDAFLDSL